MTSCSRCGKTLAEPPGGAAQAIFGSGFSLSGSLEYNCRSCGAVYCLDCMSDLKKRDGTCPRCGQRPGW